MSYNTRETSELDVKIRLEEIILDSAKIFSTPGKNSRLDDKILDSEKSCPLWICGDQIRCERRKKSLSVPLA